MTCKFGIWKKTDTADGHLVTAGAKQKNAALNERMYVYCSGVGA